MTAGPARTRRRCPPRVRFAPQLAALGPGIQAMRSSTGVLSSAHEPPSDSGPIANPASGIACTAQDHNPRWDHPGGLMVYMPVLRKLDSDGLVLHFLPSQVWPRLQQRLVALLQQIQPFGQQTVPHAGWPVGQQRLVAL